MKLALFKRGAVQAKKVSGQAKGMGQQRKAARPKERKIGIFGHTRAGKTVFLTMLWHQTHGRRDFSLETDDYQTRQDMSRYYDLLAASEWPPPTATERLYRFTAVIDTTIRYPFESQDYQGESVSIDREVEAGREFLEYFEKCDCVFVLVDAEDLVRKGEDAALRRRKKIDSFELMLAQLVEGTRNRLRIPVAVVVTKADLLDGFRGEDQVALVGDDIRYSRYRGYESFVSAVLQQTHVAAHLPWRDQVNHVLQLLKPLIDYCLTKSPDLQVFFISSTGGVERVAGPEGQEVTRPPRELRAIGLERPFVWSVRLLMQKRRALIARRIKWWVVGVAAAVVVILSLFNLWQEGRVQRIRKLAGLGGVGGGSPTEKVAALEAYRNHLFTGFFRGEFRETVDLVLDYERVRALSARMRDAIEAVDFEGFSEARRAMRELRDQVPTASQEFRSYDETLTRREEEWDRTFAQNKLEPMIASARTGAAEIENAIKLLFRPETREDWTRRWRQRQSSTMGELRRQDLDQILRATGGLGGQSWTAVERIAELCKAYLASYADDVNELGPWRSAFATIREVESLLGRALQSRDNAGELRGIAAQLRSLGPVEGQSIGDRLASHLSGLGSDVVASSAGEELGLIVQEIDGGDVEYRFSEELKSRLARFTRSYGGTAEAQRVTTFQRKIDAIESAGLNVKIEVGEIPRGYHLRVWNLETQAWDPSDLEPGFAGRLRWKPGDAVKFGIEKTDPQSTGNKILDEWEVTGRWSLLRINQEGGRHVFKGNLAVSVIFPELEKSLPRL